MRAFEKNGLLGSKIRRIMKIVKFGLQFIRTGIPRCAYALGREGVAPRRPTVMREKIQRRAIVPPPVRDPEISVQHLLEAGRAEPENPKDRILMIGLMVVTLHRNKMQWARTLVLPRLVLWMLFPRYFVVDVDVVVVVVHVDVLPPFRRKKFSTKATVIVLA